MGMSSKAAVHTSCGFKTLAHFMHTHVYDYLPACLPLLHVHASRPEVREVLDALALELPTVQTVVSYQHETRSYASPTALLATQSYNLQF